MRTVRVQATLSLAAAYLQQGTRLGFTSAALCRNVCRDQRFKGVCLPAGYVLHSVFEYHFRDSLVGFRLPDLDPASISLPKSQLGTLYHTNECALGAENGTGRDRGAQHAEPGRHD